MINFIDTLQILFSLFFVFTSAILLLWMGKKALEKPSMAKGILAVFFLSLMLTLMFVTLNLPRLSNIL